MTKEARKKPAPLAIFYASGLVLRRPVIRSPSFHWPRFLSNSVRSKRLSTFRLPPNVAAARRLRCCDIISKNLKNCRTVHSAPPAPKESGRCIYHNPPKSQCLFWEHFTSITPIRLIRPHYCMLVFDVACWMFPFLRRSASGVRRSMFFPSALLYVLCLSAFLFNSFASPFAFVISQPHETLSPRRPHDFRLLLRRRPNQRLATLVRPHPNPHLARHSA